MQVRQRAFLKNQLIWKLSTILVKLIAVEGSQSGLHGTLRAVQALEAQVL